MHGIVLDHQNAQTRLEDALHTAGSVPVAGCGWLCLLSWLGPPEASREEEFAAGVQLALHPDAAAHHVHQPRTDRQTKTSAAMLARGGSVGLTECIEDEALILGRNSDPGIAHREQQGRFGLLALRHANFDADTASFCELHRVSDQIQ